MELLDQHRNMLKTPEAIAYASQLVLAEPAITTVVEDIEAEPQLWGSSALHFAARDRANGEQVLLKLNVPPDQLWWTRALADHAPEQLPRVFATGEQVGTTRLGWVIWERVAEGLHPGWQGREFDMLLDAGVRFQRVARQLTPAAQAAGILHELRIDDLATQIEQGIRRDAPAPAEQVLRRLAADWAWVSAVCETETCHGDLHMANALSREPPPGGVALLIDHHPTRMPWAYEPTKAEILNAEPGRAGCRELVTKQAAIRQRYGLSTPSGAELMRLQAIVLGWCAIQMWSYIGASPDPNWRGRDTWHAENRAYIAAAARA